MSYYFNIQYQTPDADELNGRPCFRLAGEIIEAVNVTTKVFLHQRTLIDPETEEYAEEFVAICSPFDLTLFPADAPDPDQSPAFYRKAVFDIPLPNVGSVADTIASIDAQLTVLAGLLASLDTLTEVQTKWLPEEPPTTTPE